MSKARRPSNAERMRIAVWAAAAGRCTLCNRLVLENEELGELINIGELAHNVGWGENSPRGNSPLSDTERADPANFLLLCRNCHKPADSSEALSRFTIEQLRRFKQEHETRIRTLTAIGADRKVAVIRVVGKVRNANPELTYNTVLAATSAAGYVPALLPEAYHHVGELNLRDFGEDTAEDFAACVKPIANFMARINEGIKQEKIQQLAVFGFRSEE